jgi:hypothetical protein
VRTPWGELSGAKVASAAALYNPGEDMMDRVENIERYLRAHLAAERAGNVQGEILSRRPFVTISRQSGTGAHSVADSMLTAFAQQDDSTVFGGWRVYDRSICDMVARDPKFTHALDALIDEEYRTKPTDMFHQLVRASIDQNAVMSRVFLVVSAIAGMGKAIIIGRGGAQVSRGMPHRVATRLVCMRTQRVAAVMERYGISERDAQADIKRRDASRERMIKDRFGVDIADPCEYDVTWNVGTTTHDEIGSTMVELLRSRAQPE